MLLDSYKLLRIKMKIAYEACKKGISVQELVVQAIIKAYKYLIEDKHPLSTPKNITKFHSKLRKLSVESFKQEFEEDDNEDDLIYKEKDKPLI